MLGRRLFIAMLVTSGSMELASCGGEAARSAQTPRALSSSAVARTSKNASLAARSARSSHQDATHEGFLATYHNPEEGISFRYPRN